MADLYTKPSVRGSATLLEPPPTHSLSLIPPSLSRKINDISLLRGKSERDNNGTWCFGHGYGCFE